MPIQEIPHHFIKKKTLPELFLYDYKMTDDIVKNKVNLNMNMFSFLQIGHKEVHFSDSSVAVNENQSLLVKNGNCLFSELINSERNYFCRLLFFSQKSIENFIVKNSIELPKAHIKNKKNVPYFIINNDENIKGYIKSLSIILENKTIHSAHLLATKFEEIMLYLVLKYKAEFIQFILSLVNMNENLSFKQTIETNVYSNLKVEEIAFLCNMSISTFKRKFISEYNETPGKWFQKKRLEKAKELLLKGNKKSNEICEEFGYKNASNFSNAIKKEFSVSPKKLKK